MDRQQRDAASVVQILVQHRLNSRGGQLLGNRTDIPAFAVGGELHEQAIVRTLRPPVALAAPLAEVWRLDAAAPGWPFNGRLVWCISHQPNLDAKPRPWIHSEIDRFQGFRRFLRFERFRDSKSSGVPRVFIEPEEPEEPIPISIS